MPAKTISLKEAVGKEIGSRLDRGPSRIGSRGRLFPKTTTVCHEDLCRLQKMGKNHIAVLEDLDDSEIHENEAAASPGRSFGRGGGDLGEQPPRG